MSELERLSKHILELQKDKGELTDELAKKADTNHQLVEQLANLEAENADLKCECRRCVYSDTFCIVSDYGKDKNGICDHFKDVFDELTLTNNECKEMREELKQRIRENQKLCEQIEKVKVVEHFEAYGQCRDSRRIAELEAQIEKMKRCEICKHYQCGSCNYHSNWVKDCKENGMKLFELKEIKEK